MDGLLLVDKPAGWTSHDVVAKLRGILKIKAIGHAGTLDPFATGLLVLGIGKGTKQLTALVGVDKEYIATIRLGATSDTFDREGVITSVIPVKTGIQDQNLESGSLPVLDPRLRGGDIPTQSEVEQALEKFRGGYDQLAPLHSAKKIGGKKLYDLARAGKADESMRPMKHVKIEAIDVIDYAWPNLSIRVKCGSGTYIRSLADDIGRELGVGGYCEELRRTKVGDFDVKNAITLPLQQQEAVAALLKS